jgi:ferredoxin
MPAETRAIGNLDLTKPVSCSSDTVGIIFPVYFMDKPEIITRFIEQLQPPKDAYVYCITSCGAMAGNTLANTDRQLAKRGIRLSAAFLVFLPDNSIFFPTPSDQIASMLTGTDKVIHAAAEMIGEKKEHRGFSRSILTASITGLLKWICIHYLGFTRFTLNTSACTKCGICEKVCPVKNITRAEGTPVWGNRCATCFACIHWCPEKAITLKKQKDRETFQYTHPSVTCADLISSNRK